MAGAVSQLIFVNICESEGCLEFGGFKEILRRGRVTVDDSVLLKILSDTGKYAVALGKDIKPDSLVVARTQLRVCQQKPGQCLGCSSLHLCRYLICGNCRFGNKCKNSHDVASQYNSSLVTNAGLQHLTEKQLFHLLLQNDDYLLPEICSHYNRGNDKCVRVHSQLPYKWQVQDTDSLKWIDVTNEERIEEAYCDPKNKIKHLGETVRRLSTVSSVSKPHYFILTTEWLWYWMDDDSIWVEYGHAKRVPLASSSTEYKEVQRWFKRTMQTSVINSVERVQNPSLWKVFQWQKTQIKEKNGGKPVCEHHLFHGTDESLLDPICQQNFDWRMCGVHGTHYGKGSYFARDASYSDRYSKGHRSLRKVMFVAHVLVGEYTRGSSSLTRPPSQSSTKGLYDSCVDNTSKPSIFVVFEKHQIYPEYIIDYS
ncbi:hypothetical protein CRUP_008836 [Coryphaenoides rupestris]|nr:hypothetical protein CRUP_008836 [Coryphaenoides rupestris]